MKKEISRITAVLLTCTLGTLSAIAIRNYDKLPSSKDKLIIHEFRSKRWRTLGANATIVIKVFNNEIDFHKELAIKYNTGDIRIQGLTVQHSKKFYFVYFYKGESDEIMYHELTHVAQLITLDNELPRVDDLEPEAYILGQLLDELDDKIKDAL